MRARPALSLSEIAGAVPLALASFLAIGPQLAAAAEANDGSVLPFPPTPSASVAAPCPCRKPHASGQDARIEWPTVNPIGLASESESGNAFARWRIFAD